MRVLPTTTVDTNDRQITIFKSVGLAAQDDIAARVALEYVPRTNLGQAVSWSWSMGAIALKKPKCATNGMRYEWSRGKIGSRICWNGSERRSLVQGPSVLTVWVCLVIGS